MKLSKKEGVKVAKKMYLTSFSNQQVDIIRVRKNIQTVKTKFKSDALSVLKSYLKLLKAHSAKETIIIEAAGKLHPRYIGDIKSHFEKNEGKSLQVKQLSNPKLLGGIRVSLGDTQWDYSARGKIEKIKEVLGGGYR